VIVAIVDTGIRYTHQDLTNQMWREPGATNFICGTNAIAGNSDPKDDSVDRSGNPLGHGTHVAGTIGAAANNGSPHLGVSWNVRLMACKAFDANGGSSSYEAYVSDTCECIAFAVANGARIINASYGSSAYSQTEFEAIRAARDRGVLFVAAAGNSAADNDTSWLRSYPASLPLENIISVAALDRFDNLAWFSSFGKATVQIGAPGVEIYSCVNGSDSSYGFLDGTSMATPHVAGAAALILANYPSASLVELRRRILSGAVPLPSLSDKTATGGRLNVFNSLVAGPTGNLNAEVFPRPGQSLAAGRSTTLSAIISDLLPVTNAAVLARVVGFTNLTFLGGYATPDALAGEGIYTASFVVPTNLSSLQVSLEVSAPGWPCVTSQVAYPVLFPPANDSFADRIAVPPGLCLTTVVASNGNASREPGEPYHGTGFGGRSVWWSWTAPFTGPVKMSTAGSWVVTALAIYTGPVVSNLTFIAANDHPSYYDWYSAVTFDAVTGTQYQIAVDGIGPDPGQIVLGVLPLVSSATLAGALDDPAIVWGTGGDAPWFGQSCVAHDGSDAARSGPVEANGTTWLETTVTGPGMLSFRWKVSSEAGWDYLRFQLDGAEQLAITGEVDWQEDHRWLEVGRHTLRWTYSKDEVDLDPKGQDAGWVDQVSFAARPSAVPYRMGDLDGDGQPTVLDLTLLIGYLNDTNTLLPQVAVFADVNRDGVIYSNDVSALADAIMGRTPLLPPLDTDGDGIPDVLERLMGLDPTKKDSLGDGIPDGDRDSDMDGLSNARELALGTDPLRPDTDGDGWLDEVEITAGSDPMDPKSRPYTMLVSAPPVSFLLPANQGADGLPNNIAVAVPPIALFLPADQGPDGLANNIVIAMPPVSFLLPENQGGGELTNNTAVAVPPIALILPADQGPDGLTNNIVIAMPPVSFIFPEHQGAGGLTNNTTVAVPPIALVLPVDQGPDGLTNNTVIGRPPVRIQIGTP
jgi:hypothetical protein